MLSVEYFPTVDISSEGLNLNSLFEVNNHNNTERIACINFQELGAF